MEKSNELSGQCLKRKYNKGVYVLSSAYFTKGKYKKKMRKYILKLCALMAMKIRKYKTTEFGRGIENE